MGQRDIQADQGTAPAPPKELGIQASSLSQGFCSLQGLCLLQISMGAVKNFQWQVIFYGNFLAQHLCPSDFFFKLMSHEFGQGWFKFTFIK